MSDRKGIIPMRQMVGLCCLLLLGATAQGAEPNGRVVYPANTWVNITPKLKVAPGAVPAGQTADRHWELHRFGGLTCRPETGEILVMDGALHDTGIYASSVFGMDAASGTYTLYKATNWESSKTPSELNKTDPTPAPRHTYGAWVYVPEKKSAYLWSGANKTLGGGKDEQMGFWVFSFETGKWRRLDKCRNYPPGGFEQEMVWAPKLKKIYLFIPLSGFHQDNVWSFDVDKEAWTSEGAKTRYECYAACFYDETRQTAVFPMAENREVAKTGKVHDLGAYHLETKKFEVLPVEGGRPGNVSPGNDAWCHLTKHDLYFGWSGGDGDENWVYDPNTRKWRQFLPAKNIPVKAQMHVKIEYDSKNDLLVVCRQEKGAGQWWALRFDPATAKFAEPGAVAGQPRKEPSK